MKLSISSAFTTLTYLTLLQTSSIQARLFWNTGHTNPDSMAEPLPNFASDPIDWNSKTRQVYSPRFTGVANKFQAFKRPENANSDEGFAGFSQEFLNAYKSASKPSQIIINQNTSKVKVRVTIQFNCRHLPTISSVQNRVNKDHLIRSLITKQFSAVHVNRFSCNTPTELYADFVFYVYDNDRQNFEKTLLSLKPSLCRAVGVHHTEMAKTIRILPEKEIINEAVNQVSSSISKAIADIGKNKNDVSDIVNVAVNNIIQLDNTSVNNIVDDLVNVINVDRDEVVSEVVSQVENQIKDDITEADFVDFNAYGHPASVKLIAEAIADETANILGSMLEQGNSINSINGNSKQAVDAVDSISPLGEPSLEAENISAGDESFNENIEEFIQSINTENNNDNNNNSNNENNLTEDDVQKFIDSINMELANSPSLDLSSASDIDIEKDMDEDSLNLDFNSSTSIEGSLADFMPAGFETADDAALNNFIQEIEGEQSSNILEENEGNDLKMVLFETEQETLDELEKVDNSGVSAKDIATEIVIIPSESTVLEVQLEEPTVDIETSNNDGAVNNHENKNSNTNLYEEIQATEIAKTEFKNILLEATKGPMVEQDESDDSIRVSETDNNIGSDSEFDEDIQNQDENVENTFESDLELDFEGFDIDDIANSTSIYSDDDVVGSILDIDSILGDISDNMDNEEIQINTLESNANLPEILLNTESEVFEDVEENNEVDSTPTDTFEEFENLNKFSDTEVNQAILTLLENEAELTDVPVVSDKIADGETETILLDSTHTIGLNSTNPVLNNQNATNSSTTTNSDTTSTTNNSENTQNQDHDGTQNQNINQILTDAMTINNEIPDELINRVSLANLNKKNKSPVLDDLTEEEHGLMEGIVEAALSLFS